MNAHSSLDSPSGRNPVSGLAAAPEAGDPVSPGVARFGFPLPFDPVRLLAGVLSRWPWIVAGMVLCGMVGGMAGVRLTKQSFALSVALIKRRVPHTVQASESGQAYRPTDLNDATLLATLLASDPLDIAAKRADNGVGPDRIRSLVEAKQLEGTDIFYVTYHSPVSADDAVAFCGIWAEEINAYTQRLQQAEAREVLGILKKEVADLERELADTNREILDFSRAKDYLGGDAQVAAALTKLSQIELDLETARTTESAKKEQLEYLTAQIRRQGPLELQLRTAKDELAHLRSSYTDANPLVQAKLQSIEYLTEQIAKLAEAGDAELDSYTGTPLGNELYLSIMTRRAEMLEAANRIKALDKLHTSALERIGRFPAIVSAYDAMQKRRESIRGGLSLMSNRLREAEIFASGAPGYWQVFQAPDPREIVPSSLVTKPVVLGLAGAVAGGGLAALLTLLLTHRTARRSVLECCAATHAPLVAAISSGDGEEAALMVGQFWFTVLAPRLGGGERILLWTAALGPEEERAFWAMLAAAASGDTGKPLRVVDLSEDAVWEGGQPPVSLDWAAAPVGEQPSGDPVAFSLLRASGLPRGGSREALAAVGCWFAVVAGRRDALGCVARQRPLTEVYLPPCDGTIGWMDRPHGRIRQMADLVSIFLAKRFSKQASP